jgi:hypothetical protein
MMGSTHGRLVGRVCRFNSRRYSASDESLSYYYWLKKYFAAFLHWAAMLELKLHSGLPFVHAVSIFALVSVGCMMPGTILVESNCLSITAFPLEEAYS